MPTFNQLVRKGRQTAVKKSTAPALQKGYNSLKKRATDTSAPQKRGVCLSLIHIQMCIRDRYITYMKNVLHGDLGYSMKYESQTVNRIIADSFPYSADLGIRSLCFALFFGLILGIVAALNRGKKLDFVCILIAIIGTSIPDFIMGSVLQYFFGIKWQILPVAQYTSFKHTILPSIAVGFQMCIRDRSTVDKITRNFKRGLITEEERYKEVVETWKETDDELTEALLTGLDKYNNIFMMADSGARGSDKQIKQLAGMRGLMADTTGHTIELPIKSNFREGLDVLEYFMSAHGARKGMSDTALRTADSGYLTSCLLYTSKPVPLTDEEMAPLGIQKEDIVVDFEEGDTVTVTGGAWEGTVGMIQTINMAKQSLTINVDLFGRETPVEISFAEVKKM